MTHKVVITIFTYSFSIWFSYIMKECCKFYLKFITLTIIYYGKSVSRLPAQFASTDCPFRMNGAGSSVEAV